MPPSNNQIELTGYEIYIGACVGVARRLASLKRGETNKVNNLDFGWHSDIEGALAELVVAKLLGIYWNGSVNTFKAPDLAQIQVRHTQHANGSLIFRPGDATEDRFVLVTGTHPDYIVRGWLDGADCNLDEYWRDDVPKAAWFVPQRALRDMAIVME